MWKKVEAERRLGSRTSASAEPRLGIITTKSTENAEEILSAVASLVERLAVNGSALELERCCGLAERRRRSSATLALARLNGVVILYSPGTCQPGKVRENGGGSLTRKGLQVERACLRDTRFIGEIRLNRT